jgi:hypothetical protein
MIFAGRGLKGEKGRIGKGKGRGIGERKAREKEG